MRVLCIYREPECSFRSRVEDRLILQDVGCLLNDAGARVTYWEAKDTATGRLGGEFDVVLTMCQSRQLLCALTCAEGTVRLLNKPSSALRCHRLSMLTTLARAGIAHPSWTLVSVGALMQLKNIAFPYWIKRPDVHAQEEHDVTFISQSSQMQAAAEHFRRAKVKRVIVQEHVPGRLLKCYCVPAVNWFSYGGTERLPERILRLVRRTTIRLASLFDLAIYGVDVVIKSSGAVVIVDVNDWPSFRSCRESAAVAIARLALKCTRGVGERHFTGSKTGSIYGPEGEG